MSIKNKYEVSTIHREEAIPWLLGKHYAHRKPSITHSFGLYLYDSGDMILCGVCTYGQQANYIEMKAWEPFKLLELNRLVVNDGLPKNVLSYFVSQTIKQLPKPVVLISYSDFDMGHHGYIYQATNWCYTGIGGKGDNVYIMENGKECHQRTIDIGDGGEYKKELIKKGAIVGSRKTSGKGRYYYFNGSKTEKKRMRNILRYKKLPYPKGDNKRYDTSYKPEVQMMLF
jgi:hypothetical protein